MAGKIYIVATPIGNLSDLTDRIREAFRNSDFIVAEDTRVTLKLLNHFGIKKPLVSYYEHNIKQRGRYIIDRVLAGETCAVCSDAGTPCVSDPGEVLVKQAHWAGITLIPVPGPSAAIAALSVSGQDTGRFCFEGFVSVVKKQRTRHFESLVGEKRTMIFYESPHKLTNTLSDMVKYFGRDRSVTIAREMTKIHEEIKLTTLGRAFDYYTRNTPKGEFVLVVAGRQAEKPEGITLEQARDLCLEISRRENISVSEAAKKVALGSPFSKSEIYREAIAKRDWENEVSCDK